MLITTTPKEIVYRFAPAWTIAFGRSGYRLWRWPRIHIRTVLLLACFLIPLGALSQKHLPAHPIDLNSATLEQLEELPGIGPVTAKEILRFREKSGRFQRVEDLLAIRRISRQKLEKIRPFVFVTAAAAGKT
jgi:competence ComEA-like helix-hairpin-helix protein